MAADDRMNVAIFPGSFDPITNGHIDILKRALKLFDKVIIGVGVNNRKEYLFSAEERVNMIEESTKGMEVEVDTYKGLLVDFVKKKNCSVVIRSLRASLDFEYEFQLSVFNREYHPEIEHVYLMADKDVMYISSSLVKDIQRRGGDPRRLVPKNVAEALKNQSS